MEGSWVDGVGERRTECRYRSTCSACSPRVPRVRTRPGARGGSGHHLWVPSSQRGRVVNTARRIEIQAPSPDAVEPVCTSSVCGGCQYQEMPLAAQRREKQAMVERLVGHPSAPVRGHTDGYGYRNKLELSFGVRRYLPEDDKDGQSEGEWLGFHPPGWFSKIVPVPACPLASEGINDAIALIQDASSPAWNSQDHTGHWRHVVSRGRSRGR